MRQTSRSTWLIIVSTMAILLTTLVGLLGAALAAMISSLPLEIILVSIVVAAVLAVAFGRWQEKLKPIPAMPETVARKNRRIMLDRVKTKWITNFLENETYYDELLPLALCE